MGHLAPLLGCSLPTMSWQDTHGCHLAGAQNNESNKRSGFIPHPGPTGYRAPGTATALRLYNLRDVSFQFNHTRLWKNRWNRGKRKKKEKVAFPYSDMGHAQLAIRLSHAVDHQDQSKLKTFRPLALDIPYTTPIHMSLPGHYPQNPNSCFE